jgi:hypothetical protein
VVKRIKRRPQKTAKGWMWGQTAEALMDDIWCVVHTEHPRFVAGYNFFPEDRMAVENLILCFDDPAPHAVAEAYGLPDARPRVNVQCRMLPGHVREFVGVYRHRLARGPDGQVLVAQVANHVAVCPPLHEPHVFALVGAEAHLFFAFLSAFGAVDVWHAAFGSTRHALPSSGGW